MPYNHQHYDAEAQRMIAEQFPRLRCHALERAEEVFRGVRLDLPASEVRARLLAAADAAECASAELRNLLHRLDEHHSTTRVQEGA